MNIMKNKYQTKNLLNKIQLIQKAILQISFSSQSTFDILNQLDEVLDSFLRKINDICSVNVSSLIHEQMVKLQDQLILNFIEKEQEQFIKILSFIQSLKHDIWQPIPPQEQSNFDFGPEKQFSKQQKRQKALKQPSYSEEIEDDYTQARQHHVEKTLDEPNIDLDIDDNPRIDLKRAQSIKVEQDLLDQNLEKQSCVPSKNQGSLQENNQVFLEKKQTKKENSIQIQEDNKDTKCQAHKKEGRYYWLQNNQKVSIIKYLCNRCILQDKSRLYRYRVSCSQHHKGLKFQLQIENLQNWLQRDHQNMLLCEECRKQQIYRKSSSFQISKCHYQKVNKICIDQDCIQNSQNLKICNFESCQSNEIHKDHQTIQYNRNRFIQYFKSQKQEEDLDEIFNKALQAIMIPSFSKIKQNYIKLNESNVSHLFILAVLNLSSQPQKFIDIFFANEDNKILKILVQAKKMLQQGYTAQQKAWHLNTLQSSIEQDSNKSIQEVILIFQNCAKRTLKKLKENMKQQKWEQMYFNNQFFEIPFSLSQMSPTQKNYLKAVYLENRHHFQDKDLKKIYQQFYKRLRDEYDFKNIEEEIGEDITKNKKDKKKTLLQIFKYNYSIECLNKYDPLSQVAVQLSKKQKNQQQFILNYIQIPLDKKLEGFNNLKFINANWERDYDGQFHYQTEARNIFKIISENKYLQKIQIKGIRVTGLSLFLKHLRLVQEHLINSDRQKELQQRDYILIDNQQQIYLKKRKGDLQWMRIFEVQTKLIIDLEADLDFHFYCQLQVMERISDLLYLRRWNIVFSNITFKINLSRNDRVAQIEKLIQIMKGMKRIKVALMKYELVQVKDKDPFCFIIKSLSQFTNIAGIQLRNVVIENQTLYKRIQQFFQKMSINNQIKYFKASFCILPHIRQFQDLEEIEVFRCKLKNNVLDKIIEINKRLKLVKIFSNEYSTINQKLIDFSGQINLQILAIQSKQINLEKAKLNNLKCLNIQFKNHLGQNLDKLFPKLQNIVDLRLKFKPTFVEKANSPLLLIPSKKLQYILIQRWNGIANQDIKDLLKKWELKELRIRKCKGINTSLFKDYKLFQNLEVLKVDRELMENQLNAIVQLKRKGVKISFYQ